ncbi:conserved hypothetical protein [Anaeromyxobacter dehalogenans 2CP-C]|uniref:Uncharacterized protein n=1 Tax=Anaeromyxobacter dehalogenans (strain 2CP-C) TaxID=290397 RepID=Q2IIK2_ANADE|nr:conserved hypothetical protein [Anaeromyxobacter dehalogenans 2CP-C]
MRAPGRGCAEPDGTRGGCYRPLLRASNEARAGRTRGGSVRGGRLRRRERKHEAKHASAPGCGLLLHPRTLGAERRTCQRRRARLARAPPAGAPELQHRRAPAHRHGGGELAARRQRLAHGAQQLAQHRAEARLVRQHRRGLERRAHPHAGRKLRRELAERGGEIHRPDGAPARRRPQRAEAPLQIAEGALQARQLPGAERQAGREEPQHGGRGAGPRQRLAERRGDRAQIRRARPRARPRRRQRRRGGPRERRVGPQHREVARRPRRHPHHHRARRRRAAPGAQLHARGARAARRAPLQHRQVLAQDHRRPGAAQPIRGEPGQRRRLRVPGHHEALGVEQQRRVAERPGDLREQRPRLGGHPRPARAQQQGEQGHRQDGERSRADRERGLTRLHGCEIAHALALREVGLIQRA